VLAPLALVFRLAIKDQITRNALNTFHGPLIGGRILAGTIKRGEGERLSAALWYSDLRNSTGLADRLPVDGFLDLLNAYFDCACGAVTEHGGQVLDIIGDAILAFFPTPVFPPEESDAEEACAQALQAAAAARSRLAMLKADGGDGRAIEFGIGVHFGEVVFGNAGTADRLKFGVLGRAVNEVARTAVMSKSLRRPVVVSDEVARRSAFSLADLGLHDLRGIPTARRLWALEVR
jgi:adenylate cyclase